MSKWKRLSHDMLAKSSEWSSLQPQCNTTAPVWPHQPQCSATTGPCSASPPQPHVRQAARAPHLPTMPYHQAQCAISAPVCNNYSLGVTPPQPSVAQPQPQCCGSTGPQCSAATAPCSASPPQTHERQAARAHARLTYVWCCTTRLSVPSQPQCVITTALGVRPPQPSVAHPQPQFGPTSPSVVPLQPHAVHHQHSPMHGKLRARLTYVWCCTTRLYVPSQPQCVITTVPV